MEKNLELVSRALIRLSHERIGMSEAAALFACDGLTTNQIALKIGTNRQTMNTRMGHLRDKGLVGSVGEGKGIKWYRSIRADIMIRKTIEE
jgi:CRP-like cAMP-binding protein